MISSIAILELNPVDLIAIEVLRIFEPKVHKEISKNKELLTSVSTLTTGREEVQKPSILAIPDGASESHKDHVRQIVQLLFPPAAWAFGRIALLAGFCFRMAARIASMFRSFFDRYFYYAIPEGDISQIRIDNLLASSGDRVLFGSSFRN